MAENTKEIVIPKEDAVFWMDKHGRWHNENGPFQHKKIIDYFHACIRWDENGFYLSQARDDIIEKVYFSFDETALFVFDLYREEDDVVLVLNTGAKIALNPACLFIRNDVLALKHDGILIKFTERSMMKIADLIEDGEGRYQFRLGDRTWPLEEFPPE